MDEDKINEFKEKLLHLKSTLQACEKTSKERGSTVELDQSKVGRLSRMDALQDQQMALETARRRQLQMVKIEGALRRIDSGEFGYCTRCGEPMNLQRLAIDPTTTRCVGCTEE